ncbi:MAG: hypothetical protein FWG11_07510 [Promicromonosporaceae bacterium]|nr:hypothetical protein [Promicromonosporaceae bacterium]
MPGSAQPGHAWPEGGCTGWSPGTPGNPWAEAGPSTSPWGGQGTAAPPPRPNRWLSLAGAAPLAAMAAFGLVSGQPLWAAMSLCGVLGLLPMWFSAGRRPRRTAPPRPPTRHSAFAAALAAAGQGQAVEVRGAGRPAWDWCRWLPPAIGPTLLMLDRPSRADLSLARRVRSEGGRVLTVGEGPAEPRVSRRWAEQQARRLAAAALCGEAMAREEMATRGGVAGGGVLCVFFLGEV